ncbi:MAG: hypothetical protein SFV22_02575 [Saprospiraceae bacterium]|nr:hypothetical protein [Saprospiraceae bacterium]
MRIIKQFSCLICILWALACGNPQSPPELRQDTLAKGMCTCTERLLALNQAAQHSNDSLAFRSIADEFDQSRACVQKLGVKPDDKTLLVQALSNSCPALAKEQELLTELLGFAW